MTEKTNEAHLDFMSKKELAPIDRVTYMNDRISEALEEERKKHEAEIESLYSKLREYKKELQKKIEIEKLKKSDYGAGVCFANTIFNDVFFEERKQIMSIE